MISELRRDKDVKRDADDQITIKKLKESQEEMRESQEQLETLQEKVRELEEHRDHLLMNLEAFSLQVDGEKEVALADADMLPAQQSALTALVTLMHVRGGAQELDRDWRNTTNAQLDEGKYVYGPYLRNQSQSAMRTSSLSQIVCACVMDFCVMSSENQDLHKTISELRRDKDVGHDANDEYFQGMVIKLERMERERDDMKTERDQLQVHSCISSVSRSLARAHAHASASLSILMDDT